MVRLLFFFISILILAPACKKEDNGPSEPPCPGGLAEPVSGQYSGLSATFQPTGSSQVGTFTTQSLQVNGVDCSRINVQVVPFGYFFNAGLVTAVSSPLVFSGYSDDNKVTLEYRDASKELTVRLADSTGVYIFTGKK